MSSVADSFREVLPLQGKVIGSETEPVGEPSDARRFSPRDDPPSNRMDVAVLSG